MEGAEALGVELNRVADVLGNFSGGVEVTLLSPARRRAGYEATQAQTNEPAKTNKHRILQAHVRRAGSSYRHAGSFAPTADNSRDSVRRRPEWEEIPMKCRAGNRHDFRLTLCVETYI